MKQLFLATALFTSTCSFAQDVTEIYLQNTVDISNGYLSLPTTTSNGIYVGSEDLTTLNSHDFSADTFELYPQIVGNDMVILFHVLNASGTNKNWAIARKRLSSNPNWIDYLCWGHQDDQFGGTCVDANTMDMDQFDSNFDINIGPSENGALTIHIKPDVINSEGHYRYLVGPLGGSYEDSLDIFITPTSSIDPLPSNATIEVMPNPASNYLNIQLAEKSKADYRIVNMQGQLLQRGDVPHGSPIEIHQLDPGTYYVIVQLENDKRFKKKIIIK